MIKQLKLIGLIAIMIGMLPIGNIVKAQVANRNLNAKENSIIKISSLTAKGRLEQLKTELYAGLDAGLTVNEIKEVLVHCYAYCGFPRSIRGLQTFMTVINERKAKETNENVGAEASPIISDSSKYERGKTVLEKLTGMPQPSQLSGYAAFAPTIDTFLKEHLFADIFERDVLTYAQRELVTISVITAIGDAEPMLQSHLGISMNVGIAAKQLEEFVAVIRTTIGEQEANAAQNVLNSVLKNKK